MPDVGFLLHDALTPLGRLVAARFTLPVNPFSGLTVMVSVAVPPCVTLRLRLDSLRLNVGDVVTV